ncbi:phage tail assembly chaperone [Citrobacter koseri]|uniref:phage tail assembly chaperone n=1 Tax=Citrobacter koseri TaxID=545 RepID=UPI0023B10F55|nr:phage tail assembly chaperone [Citrobacter koseri]
MAAKFTLTPKPTFKLSVNIPRPGEDDGLVTLTVRHKTRKQLKDMEDALKNAAEQVDNSVDQADAPLDYLAEIIESWNIDSEYNRDNLALLLENYPRAFDSIVSAYTKELYSVREKN